MNAERSVDVKMRRVWLECPEHLGVATHTVADSLSSGHGPPSAEHCDLEDGGANCRRSCFLGIAGRSPLTQRRQ